MWRGARGVAGGAAGGAGAALRGGGRGGGRLRRAVAGAARRAAAAGLPPRPRLPLRRRLLARADAALHAATLPWVCVEYFFMSTY